MVLNLLINVFNVILNTLFIYETRSVEVLGLRFTMWGAGWGVGGAAFASGLSTALVCLLFLTVLFRKKSPIRISLKQRYKFERGCLLAAWRLGLPAALERSIMCLAQIVITAIITGIGTVAVASNHLAVTAESISYLPASGVAVAGTTLVGQAMGAGRKDLAQRFARMVSWMGVGIMTLGGAVLFLFSTQLIQIFSQDPQVIEPGQPGAAHRGLRRAPVRGVHRGLRRAAGGGGLQGALPHQPGHHVGGAHHPVPDLGGQPGAHRRVAGHGRRAVRPGPGVHGAAVPGPVAAHRPVHPQRQKGRGMSQNLVFPANPQNPFTTAPGCARIYKLSTRTAHGPIAQLGERSVRIREVEGSNPFGSTRFTCQK